MRRFFVILLTLITFGLPAQAFTTILCSFTATAGTTLQAYSVGGEMAFTRNTVAGAANNAVVSNANRIRANGTSGSIDYVNNFTPASSDYWMQGDMTFFTFPNVTTYSMGIGVRVGTSAFTGYYLLVQSNTSSTIKIILSRAGNATPLATTLALAAPAANSVYRLKIGVFGGNTPTLLASYADITTNANAPPTFLAPVTPAGADIITATGNGGTYIAGIASFISDSTGFHLDNLKLNDAISAIAPSTTNMWDNGYPGTGASGAPHWSSLSSLHVQTDATDIAVTGISTIYSGSGGPAFAQFGERIDGVNQPVMQFTAQAVSTNFGPATSGTNSIYEIINGGQAKPSGTLLESYFTNTVWMGYSVAPTTLLQPSNIPRILTTVDSVSGGANATLPGYRGYPMQLRYNKLGGTNISYMLDGWGSRAFFDVCPDAAGETSYVAQIAAFYGPPPTTFIFYLGGNDYLRPAQSAANFQTRLSGFIGKFHTQFPNCRVYIVGFIHLYVGEGNNTPYGDNAPAYRTAASTVAAANPTYCTYIDSSVFPVTSSMTDVDQVHPLSVGHDVLYHEFAQAFGFKTVVIGTSNTNFNGSKTTVFRP